MIRIDEVDFFIMKPMLKCGRFLRNYIHFTKNQKSSNTKSKLKNLTKEFISITNFVTKVKDIVIQLSTYRYKVLEEDEDYDLFHATISSKVEALIVREFRAMFLTNERRLEKIYEC